MSAAAQTSGTATRLETCAIHGIAFPQVLFPRSGPQEAFWVGTCSECDKDATLSRRADEILRTQMAEIEAEAREIIATRECEIRKKTDKELAKDVAGFSKAQRPLLESWVRQVLWDQIFWELECARKEKIVAGLRSAGR